MRRAARQSIIDCRAVCWSPCALAALRGEPLIEGEESGGGRGASRCPRGAAEVLRTPRDLRDTGLAPAAGGGRANACMRCISAADPSRDVRGARRCPPARSFSAVRAPYATPSAGPGGRTSVFPRLDGVGPTFDARAAKVSRKTHGLCTKARALEDDGPAPRPPLGLPSPSLPWPRTAARRDTDDDAAAPRRGGSPHFARLTQRPRRARRSNVGLPPSGRGGGRPTFDARSYKVFLRKTHGLRLTANHRKRDTENDDAAQPARRSMGSPCVKPMRCCGWALGLALVVAARAPAAQVIAPRDVAARLAVGPDGRAFVVSPSAGRGTLTARRRAALPGGGVRPVARADALHPRRPGGGRRRRRRRQRRDRRSGPPQRARRRLRPGRSTRQAGRRRSRAGARADFAASAVASSGAAVVVWFRHRSAGRWRLEAATRAPGARRFGAPERSRPSCAAHAARACPSRSGRAATRSRRGAPRRAPRSGPRCAPGAALRHGRSGWPPTRATPRGGGRLGGAVALTLQHPARAAARERRPAAAPRVRPRGRSGRPSTSTAAAG